MSIDNDPSHPSTPYRFSSSSISIGCGGTVDITNNSTAPHTFSPQQGGFHDSGNINPKASSSVRFFFRGTFGFYCAYHSWMTGKVMVS